MRFNKGLLIWLIALGVSTTMLSEDVSAQPPGSWSKFAIGQYIPLDFAFSDSLNGIMLCTPLPPTPKVKIDTIYCFSTIDGGRSWSQSGLPIPRYVYKGCVDGLASPAVGSAFLDEQLSPSLASLYRPTRWVTGVRGHR